MFPLSRHYLSLSIAATILSGCAGDPGRYPSLDIRPAERIQGSVNPAAPFPFPEQPAVSEQTLATITERARSAHAEFLSAAPRAAQLASSVSGREAGSNEWAAAQVALADLDSARSSAAISLGELDILYVDARLSNQALAPIDSAREEVLAMLREEDRILADLRATVR
ncbi:hypothetical protein [Altererythrobacter sp. MF3-039]|uniref:hypothetical protein n=1 Tax=Altererythrobacter sp. MF3-039 TaxID=3252901 RepID=UPI00390C7FD5